MNQHEEHAKTYYEALYLALDSNNKSEIQRAQQMAETIDFTQVSQKIIDKIDELYHHDNYTE